MVFSAAGSPWSTTAEQRTASCQSAGPAPGHQSGASGRAHRAGSKIPEPDSRGGPDRSMLGVSMILPPLKPTSPKPRSSATMSRMLGLERTALRAGAPVEEEARLQRRAHKPAIDTTTLINMETSYKIPPRITPDSTASVLWHDLATAQPGEALPVSPQFASRRGSAVGDGGLWLFASRL